MQSLVTTWSTIRIEEGPASAADVDQVTGLMNRSCFQSVLEQEMQDAVRSNGSGGLLYIDLDDFYAVNDAFGHHVGDDVLRHVSHVLQDIMPAGAIVARVGGDEFGVLLPHASAEEAVAAGRRMLTALNEPATCGTEPIYVRASIGVATFSHDATQPRQPTMRTPPTTCSCEHTRPCVLRSNRVASVLCRTRVRWIATPCAKCLNGTAAAEPHCGMTASYYTANRSST